LKRWDEALAVAREIETRFPAFEQQFEADYLVGRCLVAAAEFADARRAYAKVIESPHAAGTQTAAMAQWMIGESYFHQEDYAAALAEYEKIEDHGDFPRWREAALLQAGKCQELLGNWAGAVETYQRLEKTFPNGQLYAEAARRRQTAERHLAQTEARTKPK
jgi:TolA-binding protein